ncbi:lipid II flippase MurJ [uncultured Thiohalocapsa sp.]|uniref:lipid II flippase MurJ n=1 Tax=uncultured Thiohalocapsa sp. TaxID=768990 RepID=UPI0025F533E1|nr:lipid II flippase MurJ [uncultured Thiohalocapsa sp.]
MIGSGLVLALCLAAGMVLGLARELLIIGRWGASGATDALLVALFLPEALRLILASGLVSSAAMALWLLHRDQASAADWLASQGVALMSLAVALGLLLHLAAGAVIALIGPGLDAADRGFGRETLAIAAWCLPGLLLHALLAVVHQADQRFVLAGLGSVLFNLPAVAYLVLSGAGAGHQGFAWSLVLGSVLMPVVLLPHVWRRGWRPGVLRLRWRYVQDLGLRLLPLGLGAGAAQAAVLLERVLGSLLPEGSVALLNLARKLIGVPAIAINSLGQVALARFASKLHAPAADAAVAQLTTALSWLAIMALPVALALAGWAGTAAVLLPGADAGDGEALAALLRVLAIGLVPAGFNVLLVRWCFAQGRMMQPTTLELLGTAAQLLATLVAFPLLGLISLPLGALVGAAVSMGLLLSVAPAELRAVRWAAFVAIQGLLVLSAGAWAAGIPSPALLVAVLQAGLFAGAGWLLLWLGARRLRLLDPGA